MPEGINRSRIPEKEIVEPDNKSCEKFDYWKQNEKGQADQEDLDVVRFDWREYEHRAQPQPLAPIPEITVETDTTSDSEGPEGNSEVFFTNSTNNMRPKSMVSSTSSLNVDHPWQVRATSNGHLSTVTPVRETCLVTVESTSRTHLSELRDTLSASVFSLVKKYMDMPHMVSASECGGSMGCIPAHIAADPSNKIPSNDTVVVGKETVV